MSDISIITGIHAQSAVEVWVKYRTLFPNSRQAFSFDRSKVSAWAYAIKHCQKGDYTKIVVDNGLLLSIRSVYGVSDFSQMPEHTQIKYLEIAKCFPGAQVYACGSRVRGDYVDLSCPDDHIVMVARRLAGLKCRRQSDFDFWVEPGAAQTGELPEHADRCRLRIPENEKVKIPIQ